MTNYFHRVFFQKWKTNLSRTCGWFTAVENYLFEGHCVYARLGVKFYNCRCCRDNWSFQQWYTKKSSQRSILPHKHPARLQTTTAITHSHIFDLVVKPATGPPGTRLQQKKKLGSSTWGLMNYRSGFTYFLKRSLTSFQPVVVYLSSTATSRIHRNVISYSYWPDIAFIW